MGGGLWKKKKQLKSYKKRGAKGTKKEKKPLLPAS